jgi:hypothetical protein
MRKTPKQLIAESHKATRLHWKAVKGYEAMLDAKDKEIAAFKDMYRGRDFRDEKPSHNQIILIKKAAIDAIYLVFYNAERGAVCLAHLNDLYYIKWEPGDQWIPMPSIFKDISHK